MGWIVRVELPDSDRDHASSLLWDLNTTGIAELDADPGHAVLLAGFGDPSAAQAASGALRWPTSVEPADPYGWFDAERTVTVDVGSTTIEVVVGGAFGDGSHPTTTLAIDLLTTTETALGRVLDFGTGTGVLALVALHHGATTVTAVDDDPMARAVADRNREANHSSFDIDETPADGPFDTIAANVLLPVHRQWGPRLVDRLAPGGTLIATGVLDTQRAEVEAAYPGLRPQRVRHQGDWLGLALALA